jgi:two-component system alkaline phosphatase synthesis response regulator PhoP
MAKILVADDERDIRELIGFTLRFAGFEVVLTADGIEAIEKAPLEQPDLILLDVRMPRITGYEVCRQLKENPATSAIPIVFLSAKGQDGEIKQGLESGAVEYIVKPFAPDELTHQVKDILRRLESSE